MTVVLLPTETRTCLKCQKQMVARWTGLVSLTYPPQHEWEWWCGCGHRQIGAAVREENSREKDELRQRWEAANA